MGSTTTLKNGMALFSNLLIFGELGIKNAFTIIHSSDGTISNNNFSIVIKDCSKGEIFYNKRCVKCQLYSYSLSYSPRKENVSDCSMCPLNAFCSGGDQIIPNPGYYRLHEVTDL